jgi:hypothetical protein
MRMGRNYIVCLVSVMLSVMLAGCKFSHYVMKDKHVTAQERFPKDSVTIVEPVFSTWFVSHYPSRGLYRLITGDEDEFLGTQIDIGDRADSIRQLVREVYQSTPISDTAFYRVKSGCMLTNKFHDKRFITTYTLMLMQDSSEVFSVLNPALYRCLNLDSNRYNIVHVFTMDIWVQPLGYFETDPLPGTMRPHVIVLYKNRVLYYRHYFDSFTEDRKSFRKRDQDGDEYPYFPAFQLRRVVEALTRDLASRIQ